MSPSRDISFTNKNNYNFISLFEKQRLHPLWKLGNIFNYIFIIKNESKFKIISFCVKNNITHASKYLNLQHSVLNYDYRTANENIFEVIIFYPTLWFSRAFHHSFSSTIELMRFQTSRNLQGLASSLISSSLGN